MRGLPRGPIAALIAFALAALVYVFGVRLPERAEPALEGWVETPCIAVNVEVDSDTEEEPWGNGLREYTVYLPVVTLEYRYDGTTHQFDERLPASRDRAEAERRADEAMATRDFVCVVNPDNPTEAHLPGVEISDAMRTAVLMGVGLLIFIGVISLVAPFLIPRQLGVDGPPEAL